MSSAMFSSAQVLKHKYFCPIGITLDIIEASASSGVIQNFKHYSLSDINTWAWSLLKPMHNESVSAGQKKFCFCSTDKLEKIQRRNACLFKSKFAYQTKNYPDDSQADPTTNEPGRSPTHFASGALVFISLLVKYI